MARKIASSLRRPAMATSSTAATLNMALTATSIPTSNRVFSTTFTICHSSSSATPGMTAINCPRSKPSILRRTENTSARLCKPTQTADRLEGCKSLMSKACCAPPAALNALGEMPMPQPTWMASKACKLTMTLRSIGAPVGAKMPTTVMGWSSCSVPRPLDCPWVSTSLSLSLWPKRLATSAPNTTSLKASGWTRGSAKARP